MKRDRSWRSRRTAEARRVGGDRGSCRDGGRSAAANWTDGCNPVDRSRELQGVLEQGARADSKAATFCATLAVYRRCVFAAIEGVEPQQSCERSCVGCAGRKNASVHGRGCRFVERMDRGPNPAVRNVPCWIICIARSWLIAPAFRSAITKQDGNEKAETSEFPPPAVSEGVATRIPL